MRRHAFNVFSLVLGLVLIVLATWIAFPARSWLFGVPRWLLPAAVILVGAALMSPLLTSRDRPEKSPEQSGDVEPDQAMINTPSGGAST